MSDKKEPKPLNPKLPSSPEPTVDMNDIRFRTPPAPPRKKG